MPDAPLAPQQAMERLGHLAEEGERAVLEARTPEQLEELRVRYLGRKAELTQILRSIPSQPEEWRAQLGKRGNEARRVLEALLEDRSTALTAGQLEDRLTGEAIDVTLPGEPLDAGHLHLLTTTR